MPRGFLEPYHRDHDLETRSRESARMRAKYPDRCCVLVARAPGSDLPEIDKHKFLVPGSLSFAQFAYVIRKRLTLSPEKALILFTGNVVPNGSDLMSKIIQEKQDADGFLYIVYAGENTFG